MARFEVTQGQFRKVMGKNPSHFTLGDRYPIENVSWNEAHDFIEKLNAKGPSFFRLPTEAEWEFAQQADSSVNESTDNIFLKTAYFKKNSNATTHPVGSKPANSLGLYNMRGNVHEWCSDWYGKFYFKSSPKANPKGPDTGENKVFKGGSWSSGGWALHSSYRDKLKPTYRFKSLGFRVVVGGKSPGN